MNPSSMSMFGVPYSPIVPSLTRWQSGTRSRSENSRLSVPMTFVCCVLTAWRREIIEYGAEGCSPRWMTGSGSRRPRAAGSALQNRLLRQCDVLGEERAGRRRVEPVVDVRGAADGVARDGGRGDDVGGPEVVRAARVAVAGAAVAG